MDTNDPIQPVNPPENPVQTQPVQVPVNNSKSLLPFILGGLVLLGVVGVGAYYLGTQNGNKTSPDQSSNVQSTATPQNNTVTNPTDTPIATRSPQNDETANWKTYSSSILSFKYPNILTLEERQKNYIVLLSDANNPQSNLVSIDARQSDSFANYENAVSSTKAGLTNVLTEEITNGVKISGKVGPGYGEGQAITIAIFKYGTSAVEAETTTTNQSHLQTFNKIISTFTFIK